MQSNNQNLSDSSNLERDIDITETDNQDLTVTLSPENNSTSNSIVLNVRSLDGSENNLENLNLGQADTQYRRISPAHYQDGISATIDAPNPREISNLIFNDVGQNLFSENDVSQWGYNWAQFIDHDMGLARGGDEDASFTFPSVDPLEEFVNDSEYLQFNRSAPAPDSGTDSPREQINTTSSFIDASTIYGLDSERLEWLREGPVDGDLSNNSAKLLLAEGDLLPRANDRGNTDTSPVMELQGRLRANPDSAFVAGDIRANENIALSSAQTIFAREHNRIVDLLPDNLSEAEKFEIARKVVGAEIQYITYNEFLPAMGITVDPYTGYDATVDPSITNEFATVGFRGHSMIHGEIEAAVDADYYSPEELESFRSQGIEVVEEEGEVELAIPLNIAFGNPDLVEEIGLEPILAGLASERQYKNDEQIDNQLRSILFEIPRDITGELDGTGIPDNFSTVMDLGAIDIQRGRDHGIASYNDLREAYGLERVESFTEITGEDTDELPAEYTPHRSVLNPDILLFDSLLDDDGNPIELDSEAAEGDAVTGTRRTTLAARLKLIYGDVDNVDAFTGMVSEEHLPGSEFGELQEVIWKEQFEDLRDGDRFFYENDADLASIEAEYGVSYRHSLTDIITNNSDLTAEDLPENMFIVEAEI